MKFNLNVFNPPPYEQKKWYCRLANSDCIKRAIKKFGWEKTFLNADVHKKY